MIGDLHRALVARARAEGWQTGSWKDVLERRLRLQPWSRWDRDFVHWIRPFRIIPDAFRFQVGRSDPDCDWLLTTQLLEVEVTHQISPRKLAQYRDLWLHFDCASLLNLEVFQMDRFGVVRPLMNMEIYCERKVGIP